jgi:hypothetical protein
MKKLLFAIGVIAMLGSCTENSRVRNFGGDGIIKLPKGQKLVNMTWKNDDIWYLTRPMTPQDSCQIYIFHEESSWGMVEGTYKVIERK